MVGFPTIEVLMWHMSWVDVLRLFRFCWFRFRLGRSANLDYIGIPVVLDDFPPNQGFYVVNGSRVVHFDISVYVGNISVPCGDLEDHRIFLIRFRFGCGLYQSGLNQGINDRLVCNVRLEAHNVNGASAETY